MKHANGSASLQYPHRVPAHARALSPERAALVRSEMLAHGINAVAIALGTSRQTAAQAAAGLPIRLAIIEQIEARLNGQRPRQ
jgi:hypothetical protein